MISARSIRELAERGNAYVDATAPFEDLYDYPLHAISEPSRGNLRNDGTRPATARNVVQLQQPHPAEI
jgi:hypothetical protein